MSQSLKYALGIILGISALVQVAALVVGAGGFEAPAGAPQQVGRGAGVDPVAAVQAMVAAGLSFALLRSAYLPTSRSQPPAPRPTGRAWDRGRGRPPWQKGNRRRSNDDD